MPLLVVLLLEDAMAALVLRNGWQVVRKVGKGAELNLNSLRGLVENSTRIFYSMVHVHEFSYTCKEIARSGEFSSGCNAWRALLKKKKTQNMYTPGNSEYMSSTEICFTSNGVFFLSFLALRTFGAAKQVCNQLNITCFDSELYDSGTQPHLNTRSSN